MNLNQLRDLAPIIEPYLAMRAEGLPAKKVLQFLRSNDDGLTYRQFHCRHEWSDPEGYRVYCLNCGLDGDM